MKQLLLVGFGGFLGSVLRFWISKLNTSFSFLKIPIGTLLANVLGCLLIGFFAGFFIKELKNSDMRLFFITGFCGGFTTFSTFSLEKVLLFQNGQSLVAIFYVITSIVLGFLAVMGGYWLANMMKS